MSFEDNFERILRVEFEAGQQSRQAEIDELQKRIDEALSAVWNDKCSHTIIDILKGANQ